MSEHASPRVNSARMPTYIGRTVRLTCKVIRVQGDSAMVEATDGGQIEVLLSRESDAEMTEPFMEFIGRVEPGGQVLKMMTCINMGADLDMKLVDDCIELMHDDKYKSMFGTESKSLS